MRSLPGSSQDLLTSTLSAHRHWKRYTPKGHTWQPIVSRSVIQIWTRNEGWALNFSFAIETDGSGQKWQDIEINSPIDRKSTRLNSSHVAISYAVFCLKKKTKKHVDTQN